MITTLRSIGVMAVHQLRRVALDGALLWLVALPLLIIYILGITLQGIFLEDFTPSSPFRVVVSSPEAGATAEISSVLEAMPQYFLVETDANEADARRSVVERERDAAVIVPANFPEQKLTVVAAPSAVAGDVVADVLEFGIRGNEDTSLESAIGFEASRAFEEPGTSGESGASDESAVSGASEGSGASAEQPEELLWVQMGAFQYFSVGITIMFTMFAAHSVMVYCVGDRVTGAYARTRALGVTRVAYLAAGFVGAMLVGAALMAFMTGATRVLFGVEWGAFGGWLALTLSGAAGVAAISFLLMTVLPPNPKGVENAGSVVYTVLAFLGGSTVPLVALPDWFRSSLSWLPNRALLDGYLKLAAGGGLGDLGGNLLINMGSAVALFALAWAVASMRAKGEA